MNESRELLAKNVSRETFDKLLAYSNELEQWNRSINLVSRKSEHDLWHRHIYDSYQLLPLISGEKTIVDFGSGAGLPGLILAICNDCHITLIEADKRKALFLQHITMLLDLHNVDIVNDRIERIPPLQKDIAISRACSSLADLCSHMQRHTKKDAVGYFLKGKRIKEEITFASDWRFNYTLHQSKTDSSGCIIELYNLEDAL